MTKTFSLIAMLFICLHGYSQGVQNTSWPSKEDTSRDKLFIGPTDINSVKYVDNEKPVNAGSSPSLVANLSDTSKYLFVGSIKLKSTNDTIKWATLRLGSLNSNNSPHTIHVIYRDTVYGVSCN